MSRPTPQLAVLPLPDGDYAVAMYVASYETWVVLQPQFAGVLAADQIGNLVRLAPQAPVDIDAEVAAFRAQLDCNDAEGVDGVDTDEADEGDSDASQA